VRHSSSLRHSSRVARSECFGRVLLPVWRCLSDASAAQRFLAVNQQLSEIQAQAPAAGTSVGRASIMINRRSSKKRARRHEMGVAHLLSFRDHREMAATEELPRLPPVVPRTPPPRTLGERIARVRSLASSSRIPAVAATPRTPHPPPAAATGPAALGWSGPEIEAALHSTGGHVGQALLTLQDPGGCVCPVYPPIQLASCPTPPLPLCSVCTAS
jgi:hypothetical protein